MYEFKQCALSRTAAPLEHPTHIAGTRTFHRMFHRFYHNHHTPLTFSIGHFSGAATARCSQLYPFLSPLPTPWLLRTLRPLPPLPRSMLCAPARRTANAWRSIGAQRLAAAANTVCAMSPSSARCPPTGRCPRLGRCPRCLARSSAPPRAERPTRESGAWHSSARRGNQHPNTVCASPGGLPIKMWQPTHAALGGNCVLNVECNILRVELPFCLFYELLAPHPTRALLRRPYPRRRRPRPEVKKEKKAAKCKKKR